MFKVIKVYFLLIIFLLHGLLVLSCISNRFLEEEKNNEKSPFASLETLLPIDEKVKKGVLPNGLTYYIKQNSYPKGKAVISLAVKVGSVLEEENERGCAHFIKHMAFNGTKNFPNQSLIDDAQKMGIELSSHINAYTSFDETVFTLEVPTDSLESLPKMLLAVRDWSSDITFDPKEVEKEKGTILEEKIFSLGLQKKINEQLLPVYLGNSRYAKRLPLGAKEGIQGANSENLKAFYHAWYRPELMSISVVGDFKVQDIENQIKKLFSDILKSKVSKKIKKYKVPLEKKIDILTITDKEVESPSIVVFFKQKSRNAIKTHNDYKKHLASLVAINIINNKLEKISFFNDVPFLKSYVYFDSMKTITSFVGTIVVDKPTNLIKSLEGFFDVIYDFKNNGFSQQDIDREKQVILEANQNFFNQRDKYPSSAINKVLVNNYLNGEPILSIEKQFELARKYVPNFTAENLADELHSYLNSESILIVLIASSSSISEMPKKASVLKSVNKKRIIKSEQTLEF